MSCYGRWNAQDDILWLEGRALMLGILQKCRALHVRGKLQLILCDDITLTLALAMVGHHPHVSTPHVVNNVPSASSLISPSLSVGSRHSGISPDRGSRVYGPPPRDFCRDARDVGGEVRFL